MGGDVLNLRRLRGRVRSLLLLPIPILVLCACSLTLKEKPRESGFCGDGTHLDNFWWVAPGYEHTCAHLWTMDGKAKVKCWGSNDFGQLGDGTRRRSSAPVDVKGLTPDQMAAIAGFSSGGYHTCLIVNPGTVYCWGRNDSGQLGNGTTADSALPVQVQGLTSAVVVATGMQHTCAMMGDGSVACWGSNEKGQLGDGTTTMSPVPVEVAGAGAPGGVSLSYVTVMAGGFHSCAISDVPAPAEGVSCWGFNAHGQLGNGTNVDSLVPVDVDVQGPMETSPVMYLSGGVSFTCALLEIGTVTCWGLNDLGQLGNGTTQNSASPVPVSVGTSIDLSSGATHTCAYGDETGFYYCWGGSEFGQLGPDITGYTATPVSLQSLFLYYFASAGGYITCGFYDDTDLYSAIRCWGRNDEGQLGNGTLAPSGDPPAGVVCY